MICPRSSVVSVTGQRYRMYKKRFVSFRYLPLTLAPLGGGPKAPPPPVVFRK